MVSRTLAPRSQPSSMPRRALESVMAEALSVPEAAITSDLQYHGIPEWDSVAHVDLLLALEEAYGIPIPAEAIDQLGSVAALQAWLQEGVAAASDEPYPAESGVVLRVPEPTPAAKEGAPLHRGLDGVHFDRSRISFIDGRAGKLQYRGYSIRALTHHSGFEETMYLLVHGSLPTPAELTTWSEALVAARDVPDEVLELLRGLRHAHAMDALRTAVSALAAFDEDRHDPSREAVLRKGLRLAAQIPTLVAAFHAFREGRSPTAPSHVLGHAANLMHMLTGRLPTPREVSVLDKDLVLHADHGANASTFSARVVTGARADVHSAVTAAIATFGGSLHGGALEEAMQMVTEIGDPSRAAEYVRDRRANKLPIYGFGHRVYRTEDPRAVELRKICRELSVELGEMRWFDILEAVVEEMRPQSEHGLVVNVDLYAGVIYKLLGFREDLSVALFVAGRIAGWIAHVLEQLADNVLIRPRLKYEGPLDRVYAALEERPG